MSSLNPPEEITIRNEPVTIPDTKTTATATATATEMPSPVVAEEKPKQKIKTEKSKEELDKIRKQAKLLTKLNGRKLTQCPKCDKLGHAEYRIRSGNHKLILSYRHSNEPPLKYGINKNLIYRQCWIGNVLSEKDFFNIMSSNNRNKTKQKQQSVLEAVQPPQEEKQEQILLQVQQHQKQKQSALEEKLELNLKPALSFTKVVQSKKAATVIFVRLSEDALKKIDLKRGKMARATYASIVLEMVLNEQ